MSCGLTMFPKVEHVQNRKPSSDHLPSTVLLPYFFYLISSCMSTTFLFLWGTLLRHVLTHEWSQDSGLSRCVYVSLLHVMPGPVSESLMCMLTCMYTEATIKTRPVAFLFPVQRNTVRSDPCRGGLGPLISDEHPKRNPVGTHAFLSCLVPFLKGKSLSSVHKPKMLTKHIYGSMFVLSIPLVYLI